MCCFRAQRGVNQCVIQSLQKAWISTEKNRFQPTGLLRDFIRQNALATFSYMVIEWKKTIKNIYFYFCWNIWSLKYFSAGILLTKTLETICHRQNNANAYKHQFSVEKHFCLRAGNDKVSPLAYTGSFKFLKAPFPVKTE